MASSFAKRLVVEANRARKRILDLPGLRAYSSVGSIDSPLVRSAVAREIELFAARTVRSSFPHAEPAELDYGFGKKSAYLLRDVQVWSNQSIARTHDGIVLRETAFSESRLQAALAEHALDHYPVRRVRGLCTTLALGRWHNYYHFMIDMLPRAHALWHPEVRALGPIQVLLTQRLRDAELALLRALLPPEARLELPRWPLRLNADRYLWLPYLSGDRSGFLPREYLAWFAQHAPRALGVRTQPASAAPTAILISRRAATLRRLANEDAIVRRLSSSGLQARVLESMSLAEQAALFAHADAVVAPHGAGLSNLLYAPEGCRVVELFAGEPTPHYRLLAEAKGMRYASVSAGHGDKDDDFAIDPDAIAHKLEALA